MSEPDLSRMRAELNALLGSLDQVTTAGADPDRQRQLIDEFCATADRVISMAIAVGSGELAQPERDTIAYVLPAWFASADGDPDDPVYGVARALPHVVGLLPAPLLAGIHHHVTLTLARSSRASMADLIEACTDWIEASKDDPEINALASSFYASHLEQLGHVPGARHWLAISEEAISRAREVTGDPTTLAQAEHFLRQTRAHLLMVEESFADAAVEYERVAEDYALVPTDAAAIIASAASAWVNADEFARAQECLDQMRALLGGTTPDWAAGIVAIEAELLLRSGDPAAAVAAVRESGFASGGCDPDTAWEVLHVLGRALRQSGDEAGAEQALNDAVRAITATRVKSLGYELDSTSLVDRRRAVDDAIELAVSRGNHEAALRILDDFKSWFLSVALAARITRTFDPLPTLDIEEACRRLAELDQSVLSFFVTKASVVSVVADGDGVISGSRPVDGTCWPAVESYAANLSRKYPVSAFFDPARLGVSIDDLVPADLLDRALGASSLVVSPHQALNLIPWPSVPLGASRLFERLPVGVVPSLRLHASMGRVPEAASGLTLVGAPTGGSSAKPRLDLEVDALIDLCAGDDHLVVVRGAEADRRHVLDLMGAPSNSPLHLTFHGVADPVWPVRSCLIAADERVTAADLSESGVAPREIVMSACAAGWRPVRWHYGPLTGDDILGLPGAALEGGCPTLVVSITPAEDAPTRQLVVDYHRLRRQGQPPLLALAQSLRARLDAGSPASGWCGFVVYGTQ